MDTPSVLLALYEGNPSATSEFPPQSANDTELWCFLWYYPKDTVEQKLELPVILRRQDTHVTSP